MKEITTVVSLIEASIPFVDNVIWLKTMRVQKQQDAFVQCRFLETSRLVMMNYGIHAIVLIAKGKK